MKLDLTKDVPIFDEKWSMRIANASAPMEVIFNASDCVISAENVRRIADEYTGNDRVESEGYRSYGRIILTLIEDKVIR